jgi:hypothetical protein
MTDRQSFALANPVMDLEDLAAIEKFARTLTRGVRKFGTILTVDRYRKELWWHVSVSVLGADLKPVPIERLLAVEKTAGERLARELLGDVGRPSSDEIKDDEKSIQIIRRVTIEEDREGQRSESARMTVAKVQHMARKSRR